MSCSTHFLTQCKFWQNYALASVGIILITGIVLESKSFAGWDLIVKVIVVWGAATCVIWWMWIMKKLYDIARWWTTLHQNIDAASQLLIETKQDLKEIKNTL